MAFLVKCMSGPAIFAKTNNLILPFWCGFHSVAHELRAVTKHALKTLMLTFSH